MIFAFMLLRCDLRRKEYSLNVYPLSYQMWIHYWIVVQNIL